MNTLLAVSLILPALLCGTPSTSIKRERNPDDEALAAGLRQIEVGQTAAAEATATERLAKNPRDAVGHALKGMVIRAKAKLPGVSPEKLALDAASGWERSGIKAATRELELAFQLVPTSPEIAAIFIDTLSYSNETGEIRAVLNRLPDDALTPELGVVITQALERLPARNDGELAHELAASLLKRWPDLREARWVAARVWAFAGELDRAATRIPAWRDADAGDVRWATLEGEVQALRGYWDQAARTWEAGTHPRAQYLARLLRAAQGNAGDAAGLAAELAKSAPGSPELELLGGLAGTPDAARVAKAARALVDRRQFVECAIALRAQRRLGRWDDEAIIVEADLYRRLREWRREIDSLLALESKVNQKGRTDTGVSQGDFLFRIGRASFHANDTAAADRYYELAAKAGKDDAEIWFHVSKNYGLMGRREESLKMLQKAATSPHPGQHAAKAIQALQSIAPAPPPSPSPAR